MAITAANSLCGSHVVRVSNTTESPILLKSGEQLSVEAPTSPARTTKRRAASSPATCFLPRVIHDYDGCLDKDTRDKFIADNLEFENVFNPSISIFNGTCGKIEAGVNIDPTLPP